MQFEDQREQVIFLRGCLRDLLSSITQFEAAADAGAYPTQGEMREFASRSMAYAQFCVPDNQPPVNYDQPPQQVTPPKPINDRPPLMDGYKYIPMDAPSFPGCVLQESTGRVLHPRTSVQIGVIDMTYEGKSIDPRHVSAAPGGIPNVNHVQAPGPFRRNNQNITSSGVERVDNIPQADGF